MRVTVSKSLQVVEFATATDEACHIKTLFTTRYYIVVIKHGVYLVCVYVCKIRPSSSSSSSCSYLPLAIVVIALFPVLLKYHDYMQQYTLGVHRYQALYHYCR